MSTVRLIGQEEERFEFRNRQAAAGVMVELSAELELSQ